jgi:hypothetical protein
MTNSAECLVVDYIPEREQQRSARSLLYSMGLVAHQKTACHFPQDGDSRSASSPSGDKSVAHRLGVLDRQLSNDGLH